jgi:transcriptional regulator with XRE-family HTH domain
MADWTFGVGKLVGSGRGGQGKSAEAWVRQWSAKFRSWWKTTSLSQSELAKRLGVSPMTVSRWTRGKARPTSEAAARLESLIAAEAPRAASPAKREASVSERLAAALEGLPLGRRIAHLLESLGHSLETAIANVTGGPTSPAAGSAAVGRIAASSSRRRGATRGRARAGGSARGVRRKRVGTKASRQGRRPRIASGKGSAAAGSRAEAKATNRRAGRKPSGAKAGRPAKSAAATWPGVIKAVQAAEGWGEGRNRRLADALRVAPSTISNWLGGHRTPRGEPRDKLAEFARKHGIPTPE